MGSSDRTVRSQLCPRKWLLWMGCDPVARQNSDLLSNQADEWLIRFGLSPCKTGLMLRLLRLFSFWATGFFRSSRNLLLENLALRQQLGVLKQRHPQPRFESSPKYSVDCHSSG
jgi:hypothetical protein